MTEYNRFVSYIYVYENNQKTLNNGFVRVETRDSRCFVYVHMKDMYGSLQTVFDVYMVKRYGSIIRGIHLGVMKRDGNQGEFYIETQKDNIENSGISLGEMAGIVIVSSQGQKYGTCWDDEMLDMRSFQAGTETEINIPVRKSVPSSERAAEKENMQAEVKTEETGKQAITGERAQEKNPRQLQFITAPIEEKEPVTKVPKEKGIIIGSADEKVVKTESANEKTVKIEPADEKTVKTEPAKEVKGKAQTSGIDHKKAKMPSEENNKREMIGEENKNENQPGLHSESIALSVNESPENLVKEAALATVPMDYRDSVKKLTLEEKLQKIMDQGMKMYPFEDNEVEQCVRLELQDIGMMPMKFWTYVSNSFLLHSYYSYRHLILGYLKKDGYFLGVPGMGQQKDRFMAQQFGFTNFKAIRNGEEGRSDFGYWYVLLK